MQDINKLEFDFDKWARLAREDPDAYENMRREMIGQVIENASPEIKRRMQGLQWQIDQVRSTSANPMASCLKISQMMWDSVLGDEGLLNHMEKLNNMGAEPFKKPRASATIINMPSKTDKDSQQ